ncbi:MAG: acetyltransferase [Thalassotalea sp.]
MAKKLVIIGAGGHGRVVADCAEALGCYQEIIFLDDCITDKKRPKTTNGHWQIVGSVAQWPEYLSTADFIVAFGDNSLRLAVINQLLAGGAKLISLIHPAAVVSKHANIAAGCVVFAGAVINIGASLGYGVIVNTLASIDHDCDIAAGVHISPNVSLAGGVKVGALSWLGIGAVVIQYLALTENCQLGAGTVVVKNIDVAGTYVGSPARLIKKLA